MADPVSALAAVGAVSSVLQIVDFSGKVLYHAAKLTASDDALRENIEIERLTHQHKELTQAIVDSKAWNQRQSSQAAPLIQRAKEINQKAGELVKLLDDLKVAETSRGFKRAYQSTRQAARAISKRSKIERKQNELQSLTSQLSVVILQNIAEMQTDRNTDLQRQVREAITKTMNDLSNASKRRDEKRYEENRILESLVFEEMDFRHDTIGKAYEDTYTWAVREPHSKLKAWLERENGIFWICGKPGSGKSTFMKFLLHNPETAALLDGWASRDQRWMIVEFFFWYLGSPMQRSIRGLLQAILYKILCECPELVYVACPDRVGVQGHLHRPWSEQELFEAARAIANTDCRSRFEGGEGLEEFDVRLVFFIDGLDEFDGNHRELVTVLQDLAATGTIKICVSCRPWNIFINAMDDSPFVIHLEELTHEDIEHYVRDSLSKAEKSQRDRSSLFNRRAPQAEKLVKAVVEKASGVFFWVFLVVRSLVSGFEEGDSIDIMQKRLDLLPGELIPYFGLILERMDKVYRQMTVTSLWLAGLPHRRTVNQLRYISFLDLWPMVDDPNHFENPSFAYDQSVASYSVDDLRQMLKETAQMIRSSCRDFLHIPQLREGVGDGKSSMSLLRRSKVEFIHRTVYDFLNLKDIRALLHDLCPAHLKEESVASEVTFARAKFIPLGDPTDPCTYVDELAAWICSSSSSTPRLIQELDDLEVQYIEQHCTSGCPVHEKVPTAKTLARQRHMCSMRNHKAILQAFTKRSDGFKKASKHPPRDREIPSSETQMIRHAFGYGYSTLSGHKDGAIIDLDLLDIDMISQILAQGITPDQLLAALGRGCERDPYTTPLARFIRNWLFSHLTPAQDDAIWSIVKLLIEKGAGVPQVCQIPIAKHRRSVASNGLNDFGTRATLDATWRLWNMETASTGQALGYVVPEGRVCEIAEVLGCVPP